MTPAEILQAIQSFLAVAQGDRELPLDERGSALRNALDRLAFAYASSHEAADGGEMGNGLDVDSNALRQRIAGRFPGLGLYGDLTPLDADAQETASPPAVGDALDDLTDLARDLLDVAHRWKTNEAGALSDFRFGFESHWGRHLRSLQLYLHLTEL